MFILKKSSVRYMRLPNITKHPAFSLVEMLMALLVASLLLAALAPVMTKKFSENIGINVYGAAKPMKACAFINDNFVNIEEKCTVPENTTLANIIIVSGGGGGGGAASSIEGGWELVSSLNGDDGANTGATTNTQNIKTFYLDENIKSLKVKMVSGGGGGGGGNYGVKFTPNASSCAGITGKDTTNHTNYATYETNSKLCVTKYNQVSNPSDYKTYVTKSYDDTKCTTNYKHTPYCNNEQAQMTYAYPGCNRPICTHDGAEAACEKLSELSGGIWTLPPYEELRKWGTSAKNLAICSRSSGYNNEIGYCGHANNALTDYYVYSGMCSANGPDGYNFRGTPSAIWAKEASSATNYYRSYYEGTGLLSSGSSCAGSLESVRCVRKTEYNLYSGGNASSGHYLEFDIPEKIIKFATKDDKKGFAGLYAGAGGVKGEKGGTVAPAHGATSWIGIFNQSKVRLWSANVGQKGFAGGNAKTTAAGTHGTVSISESNVYYDSTSSDDRYNNVVTGASILYEDFSNLVTGFKNIKGLAGSENGPGASVWPNGGEYGKGGNGGKCTLDSNSQPVCEDGKGGKGGRVELYAKKIYSGAGGAGGNAGGLLHIRNIKVTPGEVINVNVGRAGSGGNAGGNGQDGGNSHVEFSNGNKYEVLGGKGGGAGTMAVISDTGAVTKAQNGKAQNIDNNIVTTETKTLLSSISNKDNVEIYPKENSNIALLKGGDAPETNSANKAMGGNGGINNKISGLSGIKGIPCGAFSTTSININKSEYKCGNKDLPTVTSNPLSLYRAITEADLNEKTSNYIQNYAPGATGGGGGGWSYNYAAGIENTGHGANGMGGYVIIYFH